ncbi:hypothetical protein Ancab_013370 [Ancistrocladus abbreviatus]
MAPPSAVSMAAALLMFVLFPSPTSGADLGVNYGTKGNHLPNPSQVIDFLTHNMNYSIPLLKIYEPNPQILQPLKGTSLVVSMVVPNEEIPRLANDANYASLWVSTNLLPYRDVRFRYLIVGSDAIPGLNAPLVLPAMRRLRDTLAPTGLLENIVVTTAVPPLVLGASYPPSVSRFSEICAPVMGPVVQFLNDLGSPLMINVYPYFAIAAEPQHIALDYALFQAKEPIVDGDYRYYSLFEAMVDAFIYAIEKVVGDRDVKIVVGETGWPTAGNCGYATAANAQIYNNRLKDHVQEDKGTPRKPDLNLETYVLELFNEDQKSTLDERSFGTYNPDFGPVYSLWS